MPRAVLCPGLAVLGSVLCLLAGCARPGAPGDAYGYDGAVPYDGTDPAAEAASVAPSRYYAPPGPPSDPWGPIIRQAAARFHVPERWVRAVMRQESGGQQQVVSSAGAMGLMQVMPATYAGLRQRYGLGEDPFDPHDNILAGTAYIREMYDRFGAPGFLAAYNAGPDRVEAYLNGGGGLPDETVNYLAAITPNLGAELPLSGPLAQYASAGQAAPVAAPTAADFAAGCDPDAAYDPDQPCRTLRQAAEAPVATRAALYRAGADWAIQVGAFASPALARLVAEGARSEAPGELQAASLLFPAVATLEGGTLYRARLGGLTEASARRACDTLDGRQLPCLVVRPDQPS